MKMLRTPVRLVLLLVLSGVVLAVCGLGMEMNRQGLASAFAKEPVDEGPLLRPFFETFGSGANPADWLAIGITLLMFSGIWFACHEALKLRHLARDRAMYVRVGDGEKAALAREVMRDLCFWVVVLIAPVALLIGVDFYFLSRYTDVERLWLSLAMALLGPLLFAYLSDRIVGTWETLRSMVAEYKAHAMSARQLPGVSPSEAVAPPNATQSAGTIEQPESHTAVVPPQVRIDLSASEQRVRAGSDAEFRWSITGANAAVLQSRTRGEQFAVPMHGALELAAPIEEEQFELVATGPDGGQNARTLRVVPAFELKVRDEPWN